MTKEVKTTEYELVVKTEADPVAVVKRMFKLAYDACGGPMGMGFLQSRDNVTEDDVFKNVCTAGDYLYGCEIQNKGRDEKEHRFYGDYVFGRMMKWGAKIEGQEIRIHDKFKYDYQAFSGQYKDAKALLESALQSLGLRPDSYEVI